MDMKVGRLGGSERKEGGSVETGRLGGNEDRFTVRKQTTTVYFQSL